ncbi:MAG: ribonuclease HII, partial [Propionibacteriaceae bacterium]|nr:ribonuclease HII [Propionibacteriaceae bacterium]
MNSYERELEYAGFSVIAGADEAGRGACAGPLVAAAVVWKECGVAAIDDSKKLTPAARAKSFELITANADDWACVSIPAPECDRLGIQTANISALRRALLKLRKTPDFAL